MSFQKIIDQIADAFSVFDFSYIISGGLTLTLLYIDIVVLHAQTVALDNLLIAIPLGLFLAYACGLIVWVIGRAVRRCLVDTRKDFETEYTKTLSALNLSDKMAITDPKVAYSYIWNHLKCHDNNPQLQDQLRFINRYWVMQALYEGLIGAGMVSIVILLDYIRINYADLIGVEITGIACLLTVIVVLMVFFAREARKYAQTQVVDLLTLYSIYHSQSGDAKEPSSPTTE